VTVSVEAGAEPDPRQRWPVRHRAVPVAGAVVALVAAVLAGHWWTHPSLFGDLGYGFRAAPAPVSRAALAVAVTDPWNAGDAEEVSFGGAEARFAVNTARARATFSICTPSDKGLLGSAKAEDLTRFCSSLRPLPGAPMASRSSETGEYVILRVRPTRPGRVRVVGVALDYALGRDHLFQRGTDTVAMDITVLAR
jgi:hypothetical protein